MLVIPAYVVISIRPIQEFVGGVKVSGVGAGMGWGGALGGVVVPGVGKIMRLEGFL